MLGNRIEELRARYDLSLSELAAVLDITTETMGLIERRSYMPTVALALRIASAFEVTVEEVFFFIQPQRNRF